MQVIVTGCAGFIGSHLVDRLLAEGHKIVGIDNFSTGQRRFLVEALKNPNFNLVEIDLLDVNALKSVFANGEAVFHLAANADVRFGTSHTRLDLEQNTIATYNVLEGMRANGVKKIAARIHPAAPSITLNVIPMTTSRAKNCLALESSMVPTASPLITLSS